MNIAALNSFIVEAKANTYVGGGSPAPACRTGSHDIGYQRGPWRYLDSYFGGADFAGQEVVWLDSEPIWAMNYFGRIVEHALIDGERAGTVIKAALSKMYAEHRRFLGGLEFDHAFGFYADQSMGDCSHFAGREVIVVNERRAYELDYRGGLIRP
ncbi:DUF5680 domain-containing protein [Rhizobium mesoamericanum]|uniref:DUF5680 domain-containing protein n=1 Tax=Rhizobium mesoamericanum STM3625 TaxID=1211777 RepID=K0PMS8_9HYPH|nr:DUF5680 domain-containing protein [Rhizobium mesoamericanum]CCM75233.1 conserved hypothetical protein [Rhizobium mesoamericanum STM3625]